MWYILWFQTKKKIVESEKEICFFFSLEAKGD